METLQKSTKPGPKLPIIPLEIKLEIFKHTTYEDAHDLDKLFDLCTKRVPALAEFCPFKDGTSFIPSVDDLILVHFSAESKVFTRDYCLKALTASVHENPPDSDYMAQDLWRKIMCSKRPHDHGADDISGDIDRRYDPSISDDIRYLFYLAVVSRRVNKILDVIQEETGQDFSKDYSAMLRLCRFAGPNERGGQRWRYWTNDHSYFNYLTDLPEDQRQQMDLLLDKIVNSYAHKARDIIPRGSTTSNEFRCLYRDSDTLSANAQSHNSSRGSVRCAWSKFTRSGMFSLCLKTFFLSTSFEDWYIFFAADDWTQSIKHSSPGPPMWLTKLGHQGTILDIVVSNDGQQLCARPHAFPSRGSSQCVPNLYVDSMSEFIEKYSLAAWNMALKVPQGQSIINGCHPPSDPEAGLHTVKLNENRFPSWESPAANPKIEENKTG